MGRYRRKSKRSNNTQEKQRKFNIIEQDLLEAYLQYYAYAANRICFPPDCDGSDSDDDETIRISNRQATAFENDSTWIAGHEFPALVPEVLEQPYLSLPSTLGTRERRCLYEICVHVGLYHVGAGQKFKDRYTVVSIHPDGFDYVKDLFEPLSFPVSRCKPWFCRNDIGTTVPSPRKGMSTNSYTFSPHFLSRHKVRDMTRKHKAIIEDLMAYPYQCIREEIESTDFFSNPPPFKDVSGMEGTIVVDTADKMKQCVADLSSDDITELGFDVEAYNPNKYKQSTCLIQLYTNLDQEYVIDVLAPGVWDEVSTLQDIFSKPSVVKIGHGISGVDVPCLHRDFGIFIVNAFDTLEAATKLCLNKHLKLSNLCKYYNLPENQERHVQLKEIYQNCDWRERPLKDDQIEYSILDVRYLIQLRRLLIRDMLEFDAVAAVPVPKVVTDSNGSSPRVVSPLKLARETSNNGASVIGGADSMDIEVDDPGTNDGHVEENDSERNGHQEEEESEDFNDSKMLEEDINSFFSAHDDIDGKSQSTIGSKVSELRYNQTFMDALKMSQQKCLSLWTEKVEPAEKDETLLHFIKRADRFGDSSDCRDKKFWTQDDHWLYKELVEWRADVAKKIGIMPSMLCPLNLLVYAAYQRPGSLISLRKLCYFLPAILREQEHSLHLEDLFSVVAGAGTENDALLNADAVVRMYSERRVKHKVKVHAKSTKGNEVIDGQVNATEKNGIPTSTATGEAKRMEDDEKDIVINDTESSTVYKKLTVTAAIASIAVFWVGMMKRKK